MSGKSAEKRREKVPSKRDAGVVAAPVVDAVGPAAATAETSSAWLDSADPRKRRLGQIVLAVVWLYVAALCLLALDQTFHWGIFGP